MKIISPALVVVVAACGSKPAIDTPRRDDDRAMPRMSGLDHRLIDRGADPCVDFYQYACGQFPTIFPIPSDRSTYGTGSMLKESTDALLHEILEGAAHARAGRSASEQKIGDAYASCMDEATINQRGLAPLQPELARIAALASKDQLPELVAHLQLIGVDALFGFGEQQDYQDARRQIAYVFQGGLGLPERDYYLRTGAVPEQTRAQYLAHVATMLTLSGTPATQAAADAQAIVALETALATASLDVTAQRDPRAIYHLMTVADLAMLAPGFAWSRFLAASGAPPLIALNVASPAFVRGLDAVIASTELDAIKAYLRWQLLAGTPGHALPAALDAAQFAFYGRTLRGQPEQPVRWKRCVAATDSALGEAVGEAYVARAFSPASKQAMQQLVRDVEAAMAADIDTLDWMSPATKVRARQKLHAITDKIGYPERWRDYPQLAITRGDAYGNALRATEAERRRQLAKIGRPVERGEWEMTAATVDAYYNPSMNDINFPAAILQPPFYDPRSTDAENYGHIGGVIGHELTHGFDDEGRQFDGQGNLDDWWTPEDGKRFDDKAACAVTQYGNFVAVDDVKVNGKLTLGENTADNGGLRLAYAAFLAKAKRSGLDLTRAEGGFTPVQRFFLGHGQNWCGTTRPEAMRLQVQTDPHSPRTFRVNGVVQNMPEFGQAFGCKVGQPMMPAKVCRVW